MKMINVVLASTLIAGASATAALAQDVVRDSAQAAGAIVAAPLDVTGAILGGPLSEGRSSINPYLARRHTEPEAFPGESNEQGYRNTGVTENPQDLGG